LPRKLLGIAAQTAGGKTSFLETLVDAWLRMGYCGLWFGPEWSPLEYQYRRMQRYSDNVIYNDFAKWEVWKKEVQLKIPEALRRGKALSEAQLDSVLTVDRMIRQWPGTLDYVDDTTRMLSGMLNSDTPTLTGFADMAAVIAARRAEGLRVAFVVFDYAQLLQVDTNDIQNGNRVETALQQIKTFSEQQEIVSVIASQVTKADSRDVKHLSRPLDHDSSLFGRGDKYNCYLTLNEEWEEKPGLRTGSLK